MSGKQTIKTIQCPFVPHHVMPYDRFLSHLEKCQFPEKNKYRKCKFNPYHVHHMDHIVTHENKCPDKNKYAVDDDDWGVAEAPQEEPFEERSQVSYSNESQSNSSKYSASMVSLESRKSSAKNQASKISKKEEVDNYDVGKKGEKQFISNSVFEVQDLEDYNPCD